MKILKSKLIYKSSLITILIFSLTLYAGSISNQNYYRRYTAKSNFSLYLWFQFSGLE